MVFLAGLFTAVHCGLSRAFLIADCSLDMVTCNNYLLAAAGPTIRRSENRPAFFFSFIGNALHYYFRNNKNLTLLAAAEFVA
jgi:hypothetical protein